MSDQRWQFYWRALLEQRFDGWDDEQAPYPGFYRVRFSAAHVYYPTALWDAAHGIVAVLGRPRGDALTAGFLEAAIDPLTVWGPMTCWSRPVTELQYRHAVEHGDWWDSLRAGRLDAKPGAIVADVARAAPIGPRLKLRGE